MVVKNSNTKLILIGLLLAIFMAAIDNTIVATAIGSIVSDIGGMDKIAWIMSAYIVATMAGMPLFGKLSDMYGRKRFFIAGLLLFLLGSTLCGIAGSIEQLITFRAIQGIGGGALMPIAFTIVYDVFPADKRGKMIGLLGAVFGIASVAGPLLGAFVTDNFGWGWVFYINVPIGIIVFSLMMVNYKESLERVKQKIDWLGAGTLLVAVLCLMFAIEMGGNQYAWNSAMILSLFAGFIVFFGIFCYAETKAKEPVIPFFLFKGKLFSSAQILAFLYGATFIILITYLPIYIQTVYGATAMGAGLVIMPLLLGVVAGSASGGIFLTKTSYRNLMVLSVITYFIGIFLLSTLTPESSRALLTFFMIIAGYGMGFSFSLLPTASLHKLAPQYRGTANSTNSFMRTLGMTIGVTIFGSIQSKLLTSNLSDGFKDLGAGAADVVSKFSNPDALSQIYEPAVREQIPSNVLDVIVGAMSNSITHIYLLGLIPVGIAFVFVYLMGNAKETGEDVQEESTLKNS